MRPSWIRECPKSKTEVLIRKDTDMRKRNTERRPCVDRERYWS